MNEKYEEYEQTKRTFFLEVIKHAKKHLDKPKRTKLEGKANHYYVPLYEKAVILCALKDLKAKYFDASPEEVRALNLRLKGRVDALKKEYEETLASYNS